MPPPELTQVSIEDADTEVLQNVEKRSASTSTDPGNDVRSYINNHAGRGGGGGVGNVQDVQ